MIIIDIETSGLDPHRHSLLSLGAVDYDSGESFYGECRLCAGREIEAAALAVNGFTEEHIHRSDALLDVELYARFCSWVTTNNYTSLIGGQQVGSFDILFLREVHNRAGNAVGKWPFGHRSVDLHSVAFAKFGESLGLDGILQKVGLNPEPKPHNALVGAQLEREAFKRLLGLVDTSQTVMFIPGQVNPFQ